MVTELTAEEGSQDQKRRWYASMDYCRKRNARSNDVQVKTCFIVNGCLTTEDLQEPRAGSNCAASAWPHGMRSLSDPGPLRTTWGTLKWESPRRSLRRSPVGIFLQHNQRQRPLGVGGEGGCLIKTRHKESILLLSINTANKLVKTVAKPTLDPGLQAILLISMDHGSILWQW